MPISPQITITPEDIVYKSFDITAVSYTSSTATYTATGHTFSAGDIVMITGLAPDGYNGTYTISSIATNTFTVANTTNTALTDQAGNAYWADATEYSYEGGQTVNYLPNNGDVNSIVDANASVNNAIATANAAAAAAASAQTSAATAYATAVAANTAASTAQTTANGKNKVTYSTSAPGSTANAVGDIWFQYGTSSPNVGRIIAQYMGNGGTSWTQTTVSGLVIANIDAGSITTGTLSVALGITTGTGTFTVNAVTGALFADSATIKGEINATSGYFGTLTNGWSVGSTGLVGVGSGTIVTSTGSNRIVLGSSANALSFYYAGSPLTHMVATTGGAGVWLHYGASPSPSTRAYPLVNVSSSDASIEGSSTYQIVSSSTGNVIYGAASFTSTGTFTGGLTANGELYAAGHGTTANAANGYVFTTGGRIARSTASSARYKENIVNLLDVAELNPRKLLELPIRAFTYKDGQLPETDDRYKQLIPGFIAEEVDAIYPIATDYVDGPESWNERMIVPGLLALIQEQEARIKALESK